MTLFKKKNAVVAESNQTAEETVSAKKPTREARREAKAKDKEAKALKSLEKYAKGVVRYTEKVEAKVDFRLVKMQMSDLCQDPTAVIEEILGTDLTIDDEDLTEEVEEIVEIAETDEGEIINNDVEDSVDHNVAALEELDEAEPVDSIETEDDTADESSDPVDVEDVVEVVTDGDEPKTSPVDTDEVSEVDVNDTAEETKIDEVVEQVDEVVVDETEESPAMEAKPRIPYEIPVLSDFMDTMLMSNARTYEALSEIAKDYLLKTGAMVSSDTNALTSTLGKYRIGMTTDNITTDEGTFRDVAITITGISIVNHKMPNLIAQNAMSTIGVPHSAIQSVAADGKYGIKSYEVILNGYPFDAVVRIINGSQHKKNTVKKQVVILELHYITKIEA